MSAKITPFRVALGLLAACFVAVIVLMKISSGYILLLPDPAHPVAPLVHVASGKPAKGGGELFFVDVQEQKASAFDELFQHWIYPHSTKLPVQVLIPPGSTDKAYNQAGLRQMVTSQKIAGAVAERQLGLPVVANNNGVLVDTVYSGIPATTKISAADVIVGVNGTPTLTPTALRAAVGKVKPGDVLHLDIRRGAATVHVDVKTVADPNNKKRALIGVQVEQSATIHLPVKVSIDAGNIGGPSAGLAFTLEVMQQLGANVTHGYKIAATGAMNLDGTVTAIGGVEQKTWGVREAGAQVFLVPVDGGNAKEAKKYAGPNLIIIPVTSIGQALKRLAALPPLK